MATDHPRAVTVRTDHRPLSARRLVPVAVIIAGLAVILAAGWHRQLSFETLVQHRAVIDAFVGTHYGIALLVFVALYIVVVALSIPGAVILTIVGGIVFGWFAGGLAAIAGATLGASVIFLIASHACGEAVIRCAGPRLAKIAKGVRADAFTYLLFLRLVPVFPFWLVNLAPAILGVKFRAFVAATALGIIPGTFAFTLVGAGLDSMIRVQGAAYRACLAAGRDDCHLNFHMHEALTPQVIVALAALGVVALIPLVVKHLRRAGLRGTDPAEP